MEGLSALTDKTSLTRISAGEEKLRRLDASSGTDFEDELASAVSQKSSARPLNKKLWNTCVEAESLFVGKMLKEMKSTVHKSEWLHGGYAEDIFEDMLYDEYALNMSKNSNFGMAKMLYDELSRNM